MSSLIRRVVSRQLIHIQKSLSLQTSQAILINRRHFAEDPKEDATTTTVIEQEKERVQDAIEQVEEFEMPPIRPTYQVIIYYKYMSI